MSAASITSRARVVIAGAGIAGIETALALRDFAGDRAAVTVVAPGGRFALPASATGKAFGITPPVDLPLARVVARAGATLRRSQVVAVDPRRRLAMLAGGELLGYESLVVAVGARLARHLPEALTFRGHPDVEELRSLVDGVVAHAERGAEVEVAIAIPPHCAWPLAGYEIALMTREHLVAAGHGDACRLSVLTAEEVPLEMFGAQAAGAVVPKLALMDIEIACGAVVSSFDWGRLAMEDGTSRSADRLVALPVMLGPELEGLPMDDQGFVRCAADGSVPGAPGVRVIGDAGTYPLKKGGLACRQADAVAAAIARDLGAEVDDPTLVSPDRASTEQGDGTGGIPETTPDAIDDGTRWWPVPKTAGRFLAPFLQEIASDPSSGPIRAR